MESSLKALKHSIALLYSWFPTDNVTNCVILFCIMPLTTTNKNKVLFSIIDTSSKDRYATQLHVHSQFHILHIIIHNVFLNWDEKDSTFKTSHEHKPF